MLVLGAALVLWGALAAIGASAAKPGDPGNGNANKGTFWVNDTGATVPSHDPHLTGATIFLIGQAMAKASGDYWVNVIPPSLDPPNAKDVVALKGTWSASNPGTPEKIASFSSAALIAGAKKADPTINLQPQQGYHFKVTVDQSITRGHHDAAFKGGDEKHKTFWLNLAATTTTTTTTTTTKTTSTTSSSSAVSTSTTTATGSVSALTTSRATTAAKTGAVKAVVATPKTGGDIPFLTGFGLLLAGGTLVGGSAIGRRRQS